MSKESIMIDKKVNTKGSCFILLYLNFFSFFILLVSLCFFSHVMFVFCGPWVSRWCGPILRYLGIKQITEHEFYEGGTFNEGHKNTIEFGKKLAEKHKNLTKVFEDKGINTGFAEALTFCFVEAWSNLSYLQPFIEKFLIQNSSNYSRINVW